MITLKALRQMSSFDLVKAHEAACYQVCRKNNASNGKDVEQIERVLLERLRESDNLDKRCAVFTISNGKNGYTLHCRAYSEYDVTILSAYELLKTMAELASIFNNVLNVAILFEID